MEFDRWLDQAWHDHADDSAGVAARIMAEGVALAASDAHVAALARLAQHVLGEHLGRHADGRALLKRLGMHAAAGQASARTLRVLDAGLALCEGDDARAALDASERIRATALAAGTLGAGDATRAAELLQEALAAADIASLADDDPAVRALAVTGNNLACALEEKPERSAAERSLMLRAAVAARACWARAGTWLEVERAEYRLARSCTVAGDFDRARGHARACLEIVRAHDAPPLEVFFGWQALGLVEAAAGNAASHAQALAEADAAFERMASAERESFAASRSQLAAAAIAAAGSAAP